MHVLWVDLFGGGGGGGDSSVTLAPKINKAVSHRFALQVLPAFQALAHSSITDHERRTSNVSWEGMQTNHGNCNNYIII